MREFHLQGEARRSVIGVQDEGDAARVLRDGHEACLVRVLERGRSTLLVEVGGQRHRVRWSREGAELHLHLGGHVLRLHLLDDAEDEALIAAEGSPVVRAPMPGKVLEVLVEEGDRVVAGQKVVRVEAMKMEVDLEAAVTGVVETVHVEAGVIADPERPLVTLRPDSE